MGAPRVPAAALLPHLPGKWGRCGPAAPTRLGWGQDRPPRALLPGQPSWEVVGGAGGGAEPAVGCAARYSGV